MKTVSVVGKVLSWPRGKFREIHQKILNRTPYQKWKLMSSTCDFLCRSVGVRVMSDCRTTWATPIGALSILLYLICTFYTNWYYWDENKITAIQPHCLMALVVPVIKFSLTHLYSIELNRNEINLL